MAITFTRANTVAPGDPFRSVDYNSLASAFNDRIVSGFADCSRRIHYMLESLFFLMRNPGGPFGLDFPRVHEYWHFYQMLEPSGGEWPVAGPGEPEGANLANVLNAMIYGAAAYDKLEEPARANTVPIQLPDASPIDSDSKRFFLGQLQRGGFDPSTGGLAAPFYETARDYRAFVQDPRTPHGNTYGGYFAGPQILGNCGTGGEDFTDAVYFFTNLIDGSTQTYPGSCPPGTANHAVGDVAGIYYATTAYVVYTWNAGGTVDADVLPRDTWLEGPYTTNAKLRHASANMLARVLNFYANEFRGSAVQIADDTLPDNSEAFDNQRYMTSQNQLAPNIGAESNGVITPIYPRFTIAAGATTPIHQQSGTAFHQYHASFVLGSILFECPDATEPVGVCVLNGTTVIRNVTLTLTPDGGGVIDHIECFDNAGNVNLSFAVIAGAVTGSGLTITATEILEGKPEVGDRYLLCRLCSTGGDELASVDTRGIDEDNAKGFTDNYFQYGVALNLHAAPDVPLQTGLISNGINSNPLYDVARRMSKWVRMIYRGQLQSYEVTGGVSVLRFRRFASFGGNLLDLFEGLAPDKDPVASGSLQEGVVYVVRVNSIVYNGSTISAGSTFTATSNPDYTINGGVANVYEYEGIRSTALPKGHTNEWSMFVVLKPYHPSATPYGPPEEYADFTGYINRCHVAADAAIYGPDPLRHFEYGSPTTYQTPHSLPGHNYAETMNPSPSADFYKSCRIYEPDVSIVSARVEVDSGIEIVRIELNRRLHYDTSNAPASVDEDWNAWTLTDLDNATQPWRSADNGIMEYLAWERLGRTPTLKTGDYESNASTPTITGSMFPEFHFTKLIPKVYADGNNTPEATDTRMVHDYFPVMEMYLRAICEGFVDGEMSATMACDESTTTLYDYRYENLMLEANGDRWAHAIPATAIGENIEGFSAAPNTNKYAETFNELARAVNLLVSARITLPMQVEERTRTGLTAQAISPPSIPPGLTAGGCSDAGGSALVLNATPPGPGGYGAWSAWSVIPGVAPINVSAANSTGRLACDGSGNYFLQTVDNETQWRLALDDPNSIEALPSETIQDMYNTDAGAALVEFGHRKWRSVATTVADPGDSYVCDGANYFNSGPNYDVEVTVPVSSIVDCRFLQSGVLSVGQLPSGAIGFAGSPPTRCTFDSTGDQYVDVPSLDSTALTIPLTTYSGD